MSQDPSQNPLEGLLGGGEGGFDMNALLQQAQQMQSQLVAAQEELAQAEVTGSVGGGAVEVTINGGGDLRGVSIRPGTVEGDSADSLEELSDLIVAAFRDAKAKADALAAEKLGPMAGGMGGLGGGDGSPGQQSPLGF